MYGAFKNQGGEITKKKKRTELGHHASFDLYTKREFYAHVDVTGHFDDLGELDGFFSGILQVFHGEDFQAGFVDLRVVVSLFFKFLLLFYKMDIDGSEFGQTY